MTLDDRSLERAARSWLEEGPTQAPDRAVDPALLRIQTIPQERDLLIPWRLPTMFTNRLTIGVGAVLVLIVATVAFNWLGTTARVGGPPSSPTTAPSTATPGPASAGPSATAAPSPTALALSKAFQSSRYHYSMKVDPTWSIKLATETWAGPDNSPPFVDEITVSGTDTTIHGASQALAAGQTYDQWLAAFHANTVSGVPPGCDGGDPATWPPVAIGGKTGAWEQNCNAAEALVLVSGRVYVFSWSNTTFDGAQHMDADQFKQVLATVTFGP